MHAEKCTVCLGSGKYCEPDGDYNKGMTTAPVNLPRPCHGCGGYGWITVKDQNDPLINIPNEVA